MASKTITITRDGALTELCVVRPPAPRRKRAWLDAYQRQLMLAGVRAGVCRFSGVWRELLTYSNDFGRSFPSKEAAEMWLLHRHKA